jgi:hypothetical protein
VDRVHTARSRVHETLIKLEPFTRWSRARNRSTDPVPYDKISHAHRRLDGHGSLFFAWQRQREQGRGGTMAGARESLNSSYRVPNVTWSLPTCSKRWEAPILPTYGGGNWRWKTCNGGAVQLTDGDSEWLLRWSPDVKNKLNRLLMFPSRSSMLQSLRAATNWTRTAGNPWRLGFGFVGQNLKGTGHYL